jgi:hypothetical protein
VGAGWRWAGLCGSCGGERATGVGAVPSVRPAELLPQLRPRHRAGRLLLRVPVRARSLRAAAAVEADGARGAMLALAASVLQF